MLENNQTEPIPFKLDSIHSKLYSQEIATLGLVEFLVQIKQN
jgi:hypothetical protein